MCRLLRLCVGASSSQERRAPAFPTSRLPVSPGRNSVEKSTTAGGKAGRREGGRGSVAGGWHRSGWRAQRLLQDLRDVEHLHVLAGAALADLRRNRVRE